MIYTNAVREWMNRAYSACCFYGTATQGVGLRPAPWAVMKQAFGLGPFYYAVVAQVPPDWIVAARGLEAF